MWRSAADSGEPSEPTNSSRSRFMPASNGLQHGGRHGLDAGERRGVGARHGFDGIARELKNASAFGI
jgi:hypothetical protein